MTTALAGGNTVVIEDVGPSRKKLTITVPAEMVSEKIETSMATLSAEAQLPGFRKGRAPRHLVEKRFGGTVRTETKNQLVADAYSKAVEEHKLQVLGEPEGGKELDELVVTPGKALTFSVMVEIPPQFDIPVFEGLDVRRPLIGVTDEQVTQQIEQLCINEGSLSPQESAAAGDYCIGHGVMKDAAGKVILDLNGAVIQIPTADKKGKGAILGVMVDDFEKQVGLPKPGQTLTVRAKGPDGHETEEIRGKDITIEYTVEQVQRIVPAPIGEIVARFGLVNEEHFRDSIRARLDQRAKVEQQTLMRKQIASYLIDNVTMDLPEKVTEQQARRNLESRRMELLYRGVDQRLIEEKMAELRSRSQAQAVRELKLFFILARIAETLGVKIEQEDVMARIAQMAVERGVRPDRLRNELVQSNQIGIVAQQVREHKTLDMILSRAKVTDMEVEAFNKHFEGKNQD